MIGRFAGHPTRHEPEGVRIILTLPAASYSERGGLVTFQTVFPRKVHRNNVRVQLLA